ncbi:MAG: endonuclease/exonuclease/phosphatase family protein, partial [Steroidobacteraceae bacterium]
MRFALVLVCAAFATGLLGRHWWVFDLFAPFRVQYGYVLLSCAILLSLLRDVRWAAPAWAAAVFVAWPVMLSELPSDAAASVAAQEQPAFKVLTLNAWFRNEDIGRVARYLASSDADVILVQEFNRERMDKLAATLPTYPHTAFAAAEDKDGAAILSRWPIESAHPLQLADASRHAQWALVRWHGTAVQVVGVHLPWPLGSSIA